MPQLLCLSLVRANGKAPRKPVRVIGKVARMPFKVMTLFLFTCSRTLAFTPPSAETDLPNFLKALHQMGARSPWSRSGVLSMQAVGPNHPLAASLGWGKDNSEYFQLISGRTLEEDFELRKKSLERAEKSKSMRPVDLRDLRKEVKDLEHKLR